MIIVVFLFFDSSATHFISPFDSEQLRLENTTGFFAQGMNMHSTHPPESAVQSRWYVDGHGVAFGYG